MPYAVTMASILAGCIFLVAARHFLSYRWGATTFERYVINKLSYTCMIRRWQFPPIGAILLVLAVLTAVLPLLLCNVNLAANSSRAGFLVVAIVPFMMASTGKNSIVALLTGVSPVKLNFLHRSLATIVVVLATVHMSLFFQNWSQFPGFVQMQLATRKVQLGLAGYVCLCLVFLGSLPPVRRRFYEGFQITHVLVFGFLGAIAAHTPYAVRFFLAGFVCYVLNFVAGWFVKSRLARARLDVLPNGCTRVSFRLASPLMHHRPGQHIYIHIPAISWFEWHPFTITSISDGYPDTVEIHACVRGNFTKKLHEFTGDSKEVVAFVSGPCGNGLEPAKLLANHDTIAIMVAGAGITFGVRLLRSLRACQHRQARTKEIHFCWSVRQAGELDWFKQELTTTMSQADKENGPRVFCHFYVTRKQQESDINEKVDPDEEKETSMVQLTEGQRVDPLSYIQALNGNDLGVFGKFVYCCFLAKRN